MNKTYSKIVLLLCSVFYISGYAQDELPNTQNAEEPVKLKRLPDNNTIQETQIKESVITTPVSVSEEVKPVTTPVSVSEEVKPITSSVPDSINVSDSVLTEEEQAAKLEMENEALKKQIEELAKAKEELAKTKAELAKAQLESEKLEAEKQRAAKLEAERIEAAKFVNGTVAPSSKFDLISWTLSVPTDKDGNKKADQIKEIELSSGYASEYFYLSEDGGMVFKSPIGGFKTSANTTYTRSELREMLRRGNTKIKTKGPGLNNWVLKSSNSMFTAGGHDGQLNATLKVDHVTTTGKDSQVGRVIIGQIHAEHNEPLRLYYRKLPNNSKGSIYFAHEGRDNDKEDYYELIGKRSKTAENPENGIALGEKFSYQVLVLGNILTVKIEKENGATFEKSVDMKKSGYSAKEEYMYFKAGVYNQNKTGDLDDYVQATFYELKNAHKKYVEPTF